MILSLATIYFGSALLLGVSAVTLRGVLRTRLNPASWRRSGQAFLAASLALPWLVLLLPRHTLPRPAAQVWSESARDAGRGMAVVVPVSRARPGSPARVSGWSLDFRRVAGAIAWGGLLMAVLLARLLWRRRRLLDLLRRQWTLRRIGEVQLVMGEEIAVPFSARVGGRAYIALPPALVEGPDLRLVVAHEAQHHRARDPRLAWGMEILKTAFFWNPAAYSLSRSLEEIQEFACDAALLDRRSVSSQAYGRCLFRAAQSALNARPLPAGTTGMATSASGQLLKRRIQMILVNPKRTRAPWPVVGVTLGTLGLLCTAAIGARSAVQPRALAGDVAQKAAEVAARDSAIPIDLTPAVLESLNRLTGTVDGRKRMKEALARLPEYRALIEASAKHYGLPAELMALPFYESGFRNDLISADPYRGAGIWQFIAPTARRYGLKAQDRREDVVVGKDDRLDVAKETDAAMRYLKHLHRFFKGDWRLAIKAYNEGESQVEKQIAAKGTRDPWALDVGKDDYLSGAIASIILLKNPHLLDL